jgi:hypothetical protein
MGARTVGVIATVIVGVPASGTMIMGVGACVIVRMPAAVIVAASAAVIVGVAAAATSAIAIATAASASTSAASAAASAASAIAAKYHNINIDARYPAHRGRPLHDLVARKAQLAQLRLQPPEVRAQMHQGPQCHIAAYARHAVKIKDFPHNDPTISRAAAPRHTPATQPTGTTSRPCPVRRPATQACRATQL